MIAAANPPHIRGGGEISTKMRADTLAALGIELLVLAAAAVERDGLEGSVRVRRILSPNQPWNYAPSRSFLKKFIWHVRENWKPMARAVVARNIDEFGPDLVLKSPIGDP